MITKIFIAITLFNMIVIIKQMNYIYELEEFIEDNFEIEGDEEDGIKR